MKFPQANSHLSVELGELGKGLGHPPCPLDTHRSVVLPQSTKEKEANGVRYTWVQVQEAETLYRSTQATQGLLGIFGPASLGSGQSQQVTQPLCLTCEMG